MKLEEKVDLLRKAEIHVRTVEWRRFVPLSNDGLVDIHDDDGPIGHVTVTLTDKGRRALVAGLRVLADRMTPATAPDSENAESASSTRGAKT